MTLEEFIRQETTLPFKLSYSDCCGMANRWVDAHFGVNCFKSSGIEYSEEHERYSITGGNLIKFFNKVCIDNGATITKEPKDGDIATIRLYEGEIPIVTAAIKYKDGWFSHLDNGCCYFKKAKVARAYTWES